MCGCSTSAPGTGSRARPRAALGLNPVVGVDILPEARLAALRDRPGLYDLYLSTDLRELDTDAVREVRRLAPNALACVGAMGSGHLPAGALAAALELLTDEALFAYAVDPELKEPSADALRDLLAGMERAGQLEEVERRRYRHRMTVDGRERWWTRPRPRREVERSRFSSTPAWRSGPTRSRRAWPSGACSASSR